MDPVEQFLDPARELLVDAQQHGQRALRLGLCGTAVRQAVEQCLGGGDEEPGPHLRPQLGDERFPIVPEQVRDDQVEDRLGE